MMKRMSTTSEYGSMEGSSLHEGTQAMPSLKKLKLRVFATLSADNVPQQSAFGCTYNSSVSSMPFAQPGPNISASLMSYYADDPHVRRFQSTTSSLAYATHAHTTQVERGGQLVPSQISRSFVPRCEVPDPSQQHLMVQNQLRIYHQQQQLTESIMSVLRTTPSVREMLGPAAHAAPALRASVGSHRAEDPTQPIQQVAAARKKSSSRRSQARLMLKLGVAAMMPDEETPAQLPAVIGCRTDSMVLSEHQAFLRQQIEIFQTTEHDVSTHARGRNKPICLGQVGIRCRHCAHVPASHRQQGAAYFPATILGLYQAAQNMSTNHIQCGMCHYMPQSMKDQFKELIPTKKHHSGVGREYWAATAKRLGLVDTDMGIGFRSSLPMGATILEAETPPKKNHVD